jgi:hypothetical protein
MALSNLAGQSGRPSVRAARTPGLLRCEIPSGEERGVSCTRGRSRDSSIPRRRSQHKRRTKTVTPTASSCSAYTREGPGSHAPPVRQGRQSRTRGKRESNPWVRPNETRAVLNAVSASVGAGMDGLREPGDPSPLWDEALGPGDWPTAAQAPVQPGRSSLSGSPPQASALERGGVRR